MRRVVRRTNTIVTVQTWTVTWTEDVPSAESLPAALPAPASDAPAPEAPSETLNPGLTPPGAAS